jgi:S-adenosylmethionine-diacylglycerol 3-amino-3-carboxypropyl transferase
MANEYFSDLNYSLSNEDTQIEYSVMPEQIDKTFSIAGSGARCLPLIAKKPKLLHVVDMALPQLFLAELRLQAARQLSYEEFLFFLGYRGAIQNDKKSADDRFELFHHLKLSRDCSSYWLKNSRAWRQHGYILLGRWEQHFQRIGALFRNYLKCDFSELFNAQSIDEQVVLYQKLWPKARWNAFLRLVASEFVFNKFLYKGHFSGEADRRTEKKPPYLFIKDEFERVFSTQLVRKNYFMQVLFLGKIVHEEGLPLEAHRALFDNLKNSKTEVHFLQSNLTQILQKNSYDFISLSDTISYLPEAAAEKILINCPSDTRSGARMVIRSFMKAPKNIITNSAWRALPALEAEAKRNDGTAVYNFHIFEKI